MISFRMANSLNTVLLIMTGLEVGNVKPDALNTAPVTLYGSKYLFQNCINGFAPLNRRAARAQDKKSFKGHLLNR